MTKKQGGKSCSQVRQTSSRTPQPSYLTPPPKIIEDHTKDSLIYLLLHNPESVGHSDLINVVYDTWDENDKEGIIQIYLAYHEAEEKIWERQRQTQSEVEPHELLERKIKLAFDTICEAAGMEGEEIDPDELWEKAWNSKKVGPIRQYFRQQIYREILVHTKRPSQ